MNTLTGDTRKLRLHVPQPQIDRLQKDIVDNNKRLRRLTQCM